ncbi:hypothetical protein L9W98_17750 [Vibrio aestuarianus]|nr:hypothetical protein [Vibrio aestuarianus]MDE1298321.1 hypothetical protein [Vibrio aestuarianus]
MAFSVCVGLGGYGTVR